MTASVQFVQTMATQLHDLVGWPFRWLIWVSPWRYWLQKTEPNSWSLLRLPLSFLIALALRASHDYLAIAIFVIALLTDRLDGELARATGRTSDLGERIDTFVDGAMLAAITLGLSDRLGRWDIGPASFALAPVFVSLEVARLIGGFLLGSWSRNDHERQALSPNLSGKYKTASFGLAVILLLLGHASVARQVCLATIALSFYSLSRHIVDWLMARSTHRH